MSAKPASRPTIPRPIWVLGLVSLTMDLSSEMIHALLPLFITSTLGASALALGLIEGVAESVALITKVFSGALSDRLGNRKTLAACGYTLSAATKPLFAAATSLGLVVVARFADRFGKGVRGAPRDALIGEWSPPDARGASFGLRQGLDTVGAFLGPLVAVAIMWSSDGNIRLVFAIACVPAVLSAALIIFGVSEPDRIQPEEDKAPYRVRAALASFDRKFWAVIGIATIFTLARFSEAFLVLRLDSLGLPGTLIPFVLVVMNISYSLSSYPAGLLSDRTGRTGLLGGGLVVLIAADAVLALAQSTFVAFAGIFLWGLHMGLTQGVISALTADHAPRRFLGTAFGVLNLSMGLSVLAASILAGALWELVGPAGTFWAGAGFATLALAGLTLLPYLHRKSRRAATM
ncbi:MAG: MFS transporter [Bdellovibrionales bacterium]|nr:MFS transporter [Bdellovibrionales bacterium]